jgi:hypothetical protein
MDEQIQFRADRFCQLVGAVERAPDERFDMSRWVGEAECGTVGCACGWYAIGSQDAFEVDPQTRRIYRVGEDHTDANAMGFDEWADHFGIPRKDASWLFDAEEYADEEDANGWAYDSDNPPPKTVVLDRLRDYLADAA